MISLHKILSLASQKSTTDCFVTATEDLKAVKAKVIDPTFIIALFQGPSEYFRGLGRTSWFHVELADDYFWETSLENEYPICEIEGYEIIQGPRDNLSPREKFIIIDRKYTGFKKEEKVFLEKKLDYRGSQAHLDDYGIGYVFFGKIKEAKAILFECLQRNLDGGDLDIAIFRSILFRDNDVDKAEIYALKMRNVQSKSSCLVECAIEWVDSGEIKKAKKIRDGRGVTKKDRDKIAKAMCLHLMTQENPNMMWATIAQVIKYVDEIEDKSIQIDIKMKWGVILARRGMIDDAKEIRNEISILYGRHHPALFKVDDAIYRSLIKQKKPSEAKVYALNTKMDERKVVFLRGRRDHVIKLAERHMTDRAIEIRKEIVVLEGEDCLELDQTDSAIWLSLILNQKFSELKDHIVKPKIFLGKYGGFLCVYGFGVELANRGQIADAIEIRNKISPLYGRHHSALMQIDSAICRGFIKQEKFSEAKEYILNTKIVSGNYYFLRFLGVAQAGLGETDDAKKIRDGEFLSDDQWNMDRDKITAAIIQYFLKKGELKEAAICVRKIENVEAKSEGLFDLAKDLFDLAKRLVDSGQTKGAIRTHDEATRIRDEAIRIHAEISLGDADYADDADDDRYCDQVDEEITRKLYGRTGIWEKHVD